LPTITAPAYLGNGRGELLYFASISKIRLQLNIESLRVCLGEVGENPTLSRNREKEFPFKSDYPTHLIF